MTQNLAEYVQTETRTLTEEPFSPVDSLVFSVLAYCHFDHFAGTLDDKAKWLPLSAFADEGNADTATTGVSQATQKKLLLQAAARSPRFADTEINYSVSATDDVMDKQFSAVTFRLPDRTYFAAFRGTDNTLTGWRENFNMAFLNTVPAQNDAARYFARVIKLTQSRLPWRKPAGWRVGGHSKGGNLAVYAAYSLPPECREQLLGVYSHDGPGFKNNIFETPEYEAIRDRVHTYLPQDSIIGTLLKQSSDCEIISSTAKGFDGHNPFTWLIEGTDFVREAGLSQDSLIFNRTLDRWMEGLDDAKRLLVVQSLFEMIDSTGAKSFGEVLSHISDHDWAALRALRNVPPEQRRELIGILISLGRSYFSIRRETRAAEQQAIPLSGATE